jgi:hypothetical protein
MSQPAPRFRTSSLASWFLLLTAAAVVLAFVRAAPVAGYAQVLAPAIVWGLVFAAGGFFSPPRGRNIFLGFVAGFCVGAAVGVVSATSTKKLTPLAIAVITGSVLIIFVGLMGSRRR